MKISFQRGDYNWPCPRQDSILPPLNQNRWRKSWSEKSKSYSKGARFGATLNGLSTTPRRPCGASVRCFVCSSWRAAAGNVFLFSFVLSSLFTSSPPLVSSRRVGSNGCTRPQASRATLVRPTTEQRSFRTFVQTTLRPDQSARGRICLPKRIPHLLSCPIGTQGAWAFKIPFPPRRQPLSGE